MSELGEFEAPKLSQTEYMRNYRETHPDAVAANRSLVRARSRALRLLAKEYADRFNQLYSEERLKEGLPPVRGYNSSTN